LGDAPAGEKIAIGDPKSVPAGAYAKQAFEALGSWSALEDRFALCQDVAQVLAWVRRAEVSAGVVYATETIGVDDIVILDEAAGDWAPRPEVVVGVVSGARQAEVAGAFFDFLRSARGRAILARHGFTPAEP
jgi:molybdate transport system substrate-binding protein